MAFLQYSRSPLAFALVMAQKHSSKQIASSLYSLYFIFCLLFVLTVFDFANTTVLYRQTYSLIENRACSWICSGAGIDALHSDRPSNPSAYQDQPQVQPTGTSTRTRARRPKGEAIQTTLVFSFALAGVASSDGHLGQ
ncbi:hypothetical protein V8C43DRAFT_91969 [Trichoderma afarasin]